VVDPIAALIATSQKHFETGEAELKAGHLDKAREAFDRSVEVLLESPYGARTDARMREHFDRLIDRINAYEVTALAQGDGFAEKKYEAAPIDELLKNATTFPAPTADALTQATVKADLEHNAHDIPIPEQAKIFSYVEVFQGRLRDYIQESLERGSRYLPMIQNVFRAEGLPLDLAYIPIIESSFKTNALSKASAKGPWQFMKPTAQEHGLKTDWFIDERSDPEKATVAAAKYLKTLSNMFDGDWNMVLAAYNGGPGRVSRAIKKSGIDDFWQLSATPKYLPRETREYVPLIMAAMIIGRNPAQYGFDVIAAEAHTYDKVTLPRALDLRRLAEWAGTSVDEIQALNPELRRWTTPVKDRDYELKVPGGTAQRVLARLAEAPATDLASLKYYTVKRGDTLPLIARKLNVSKTDLAEANYLSVTARLVAGEKLMVPHEATVLMAARAERGVPVADARRTVTTSGELAQATSSNRVRTVYQVKRGDTLASIARLFETTVASIKTWNPRLPGDRVTTGQRLTVYRLAN
jgi:membrane-bound lytic murein transglycosylase D